MIKQACLTASMTSKKKSEVVSSATASTLPSSNPFFSKSSTLPFSVNQHDKEGYDGDGSFSNYPIAADTQKNLVQRGITRLFPIQQKTFHAIFEGKHVIGRARTGTGKTLAFALPVVESLRHYARFSKKVCRLLALLPTRELAQQVAAEFQNLSQNHTLYSTVTVVGGVSEETQIRALNQGAHIVIGTPGRVLDFLSRNLLDLKKLRILVLDEADQMLEMGFKEDVDSVLEFTASCKKTCRTSCDIQILLFTATLPPWVSKIAETYMTKGEKVVVDVVKNEQVSTASGIEHLSILCGFHQRIKVLGNVITYYAGTSGRCIVFVETKANANDISMSSDISHFCQVLHGDVPQKQRETTLKAFKEGKFRCLVATDVAARGLHVDNIELVIQLEPPKDVETFIHRAGRTGRAGAKGINIVFHNPMNAPFLKTIEASTGIKFKRVGIPQIEQLISTESIQVVKKILEKNQLPESVLRRCEEATNKLLAVLPPEKAVAILLLELAVLSENGFSCKVVYSALTGNEGYKTFSLIILSGVIIQSKNYVWQVLKNGVGVDQATLNQVRRFLLDFDLWSVACMMWLC